MDTFKKIGKYKYGQRHCLGEGSFGKVYEGYDQSGRRVAIKKIQQRMIATDPYLKQSLHTEITIMKKLKHKNIVELIDTVTTTNSIYLILQYCKDGDLKRYSMNKRFTEEQALDILKQLIQGFCSIVKQGIIHRDLKPANVLVHDGVFKICDFGFAKYFGQLNKMARTCVGTPIYMSPQVLKQKPYTSKSDIWGLGVMYYEILFGKIPFLGKSQDEIYKIITRGKLSIPKCSQTSYIFIKNALAINQQQRWDWKTVFEHFGIKQNKQKPVFYQQNFINFMRAQTQQFGHKPSVINQNKSYERKENKMINFNDKNIDIRYGSQRQSPQQEFQVKGKHNKMAKNIFALDDHRAVINGPYNGNYMQPLIKKQENNLYFERVYKQQQTQKARWLYNIVMRFLMKSENYSVRIPSYEMFLYSLTSYAFEQYLKQTNQKNMIQMVKIKRIIIQQQKQLLSKLLQQIKKYQPCQNIKSITSVVLLQGKNTFSIQQLNLLEELKNFNI